MKICCFTGHRPNKFTFGYNESAEDCKRLKNVLEDEIHKLILKGYRYFVTGMAQGVDQWAAEILIKLKRTYSDIVIEAAIPCLNQEKNWPEKSKDRYAEILGNIDVFHRTGLLTFDQNPGQMNTRNYCMINKSDTVIAVYDRAGSEGEEKSSGTKNAFEYAVKMKRDIVEINPISYEVKYIEGTNSEKVLECSSKGDANYSALYARVEMYGVEDTIESIYQLAKRFDGKQAESIKEAKGKTPTSFVLKGKEFDVKHLSALYKLLWCKYLDRNPDLVEYAKIYDRINDAFRGKSVNCQADVIAQYVRVGRKFILDECGEFIRLLK